MRAILGPPGPPRRHSYRLVVTQCHDLRQALRAAARRTQLPGVLLLPAACGVAEFAFPLWVH
jgi:hypothetical protein